MTTLADLDQYIGADLTPSATGDIQTATDTMRGQQRVLRRLLTNPGDYIFHPDYGAGLPAWVGKTADIGKMKALIRGQMLLEAAVAKSSTPDISITAISSGDGGGFAVSVRYTDAFSGTPVSLSFNVSA